MKISLEASVCCNRECLLQYFMVLSGVSNGYNEEFKTFPKNKKAAKVLGALLQTRKKGFIIVLCGFMYKTVTGGRKCLHLEKYSMYC